MKIEQRIDRTLVEPLTRFGFESLGRMRTRTAREIGTSPWSIGCETIDRGYVDFAHTGPHLGELGATQARVQAGWARCEPNADGAYDWAWLDAIVDGCVDQGVRPWLECSYGNPRYRGGGGIGLAEGIPTSSEALAGWDRWVEAMARRYDGRVDTWEIWNEPDIHNAVAPDAYADFFVRTGTILRRVQPHSKTVAMGLASQVPFAEAVLKRLASLGKAELMSELSYHFYPHIPESNFDVVDRLSNLLEQFAPHVTLRQGETGAPSESIRFMALGDREWSERKQAAWNARRLLIHHARGIPMSLFQLADMQYTKAQGAKFEGRNPKGQLCINPDKTVAYRKPSFSMAQHVFSLFDSRFTLQRLARLTTTANFDAMAYAWHVNGRPAIVGWWRHEVAPELAAPPLETIGVERVPVEKPMLLEIISGTLFEPPSLLDWTRLPCADVPLLLVDRSLVEVAE
jgi:hypothetical protein